MSNPGTVVLRRTWPQRLVIACSLAVISLALVVAWFINDVYVSLSDIGRVHISGEVLLTDTAPGEPVNFLLIGEDSAAGLDPDDPAAYAREVDSRGRYQADSITIVRVDPMSGQAWLLSVPRDLLIDDRGTQRKINSLLLVESPERLVEAITANFGIPINHFMSLDFLGFRRVVDDLDGIPVWFEHPARDTESGLYIETSGCHVLDGVQALQYVRSRHYQEDLGDDDWVTVGNADFGRIERQQDFLVLALDRAIDRGARNPATLARLIEAGASSIVLDGELTVAELIDVGEAFSEFDPDSLQRFGLQVSTVGSGADYEGEMLVPEVNEPIFGIFRGVADLPPAEDVAFDLYLTASDAQATLAEELGNLGFTVSSVSALASSQQDNVVVYPSGGSAAAETIARWLEPIPRLVEDPDATAISVVLGRGHEQVLFLFPHEIAKMQAAVAALGDGAVPDLSGAVPLAPTTSDVATPTTSGVAAAPTTTAPDALESSATTTSTTTPRIIGRAPEGQSCG